LETIHLGEKQFQVSKFVHTLRLRLMKAFLGIENQPDNLVQDITSDRVYKNIWQATSDGNTKIYAEVFKATPERIFNLDGIKDLHPSAQQIVNSDYGALTKLKGFVDFPLSFLKDVHHDMSPTVADKEYIVPRSIFL